MARVKTLFFDVGNTLLFPDWERILAPLHERQVFPQPTQLLALERRTKREFDALGRDGRVDHGFWYIFYSHLLEELDLHDDRLRGELVNRIRVSANWRIIRPGTREILQRLGALYRLGIISNADGKIADVLKACGIDDCFLSITDSGLVGKEKPHPAVFEAALRSLNAEAGQSLYVGDVYSVDYVGAANAGMQAILLDASGAYRDTQWPRVESLTELEAKLEEVWGRSD